MTRDLDSMTVQALSLLDPNEVNSVVIDLVQNSLDVAVKYNQAQALNNSLNLEKLKAERSNNIVTYNNAQQHLHQLQDRRNALYASITAVQNQEAQLAAKGTDPNDPAFKNLSNQEKTLQGQLDSVNADIANAKDTSQIPAASLDSSSITEADLKTQSNNNLSLDKLPQKFQDALTSQLGKPSFPPVIKMDNVIDVLRQRIAREFSAMYDDLMREPNKTVYLMEFDTSIQPDGKASDRVARISLSLKGAANSNRSSEKVDCSDLRVYDVYPAAAAYNTMQGFSKTSHVGITGVAQTIFGLGISAAYQHDHSNLRSGLSQSNYVSGFGSGQSTFGWDFAPAPYDTTVAAGVRTTYAILLAPKGVDSQCTITADMRAAWLPRGKRYPGWNPAGWGRGVQIASASDGKLQSLPISIQLPGSHAGTQAGPPLREVTYVPFYGTKQASADEVVSPVAPGPQTGVKATPNPSATPSTGNNSSGARADLLSSQPAGDTTILVTLRNVADPNLVITVNDQVLKRVRDVRGRALYTKSTDDIRLAGNAGEQASVTNSRFGLLESDSLGPDTWYLADQNNLLLRISKATAGTDHFPVIRLIDPVKGGGELTTLAQQADSVRIGEWLFTQRENLPQSAFQPLYANAYGPGRVEAYIDDIRPARAHTMSEVSAIDIRLVSFQIRDDGRPTYLHDQAQVVLEVDTKDSAMGNGANWALWCRQDKGQLVCELPLREIGKFCNSDWKGAIAERDLSCVNHFKIWVDQTPYFDRPGIWSDTDLAVASGSDGLGQGSATKPALDVIPESAFRIRTELKDGDPEQPQWVATLKLRNFRTSQAPCLEEFQNLLDRATNEARDTPRLRPNFNAKDFTSPNGVQGNNSPFALHFVDGSLSFEIPYKYFWLLPQSFHLLPQCSESVDPVELPNLREQLLPRELMLSKSGEATWRIQGRNLGAVNQVYFSGTAPVAPQSANSTDKSTEFSTAKLKPGTYKIYLGIQNYFVPAKTWNGSATEQMVIVIPPKVASTPPAGQK